MVIGSLTGELEARYRYGAYNKGMYAGRSLEGKGEAIHVVACAFEY